MSESPVVTGATISGLLVVLVNSAVAMLTALGVVHWDTNVQSAINAFVVALVNAAAVILPMIWVHKQVTPLSNPKDEDGATLVRAGTQAPTITQARNALKG